MNQRVPKLLLIDDDALIVEAMTEYFQVVGIDVLTTSSVFEIPFLIGREKPDVVLLDISMPRMNGYDVLKAIRQVSDVPVLMLTGRGDDVDQVRGLESGADDYVAKPFSHLALMARIKAVLRRAELPPPVQALADFEAGDLAIHFQNHEVTVAGAPVKLTPVEYKLLYHLVRNAGHLMPHQALLDRVWGGEYEAGPEYLKVFVSRLRSKLRHPGGPEYIETERGRGYRFIRPSAKTALVASV